MRQCLPDVHVLARASGLTTESAGAVARCQGKPSAIGRPARLWLPMGEPRMRNMSVDDMNGIKRAAGRKLPLSVEIFSQRRPSATDQ
jgi:hypothetical protein